MGGTQQPAEPERVRRRRGVSRQRRDGPPHRYLLPARLRPVRAGAADHDRAQPHPRLWRAARPEPPSRHLHRGLERRADPRTTGSTTTPTGECRCSPTRRAVTSRATSSTATARTSSTPVQSANNIVEHNVISNAVLRWNIEDWELSGTGNVARNNCVWTTRTDLYNRQGGIMVTRDFIGARQPDRRPAVRGPGGEGLPPRSGSPCAALLAAGGMPPPPRPARARARAGAGAAAAARAAAGCRPATEVEVNRPAGEPASRGS